MTLTDPPDRPTLEEISQLYQRMREEDLLARVVQGDESLEEFREIAAETTFQVTRDTTGEIAGFWWLSPVYGASCAFHFCLFRPYRKQAPELFADIAARLFSAGVGAIFAFTNTKHHDLTRFCRGVGFKHIETINNINKERLHVWVAKPAAY